MTPLTQEQTATLMQASRALATAASYLGDVRGDVQPDGRPSDALERTLGQVEDARTTLDLIILRQPHS